MITRVFNGLNLTPSEQLLNIVHKKKVHEKFNQEFFTFKILKFLQNSYLIILNFINGRSD